MFFRIVQNFRWPMIINDQMLYWETIHCQWRSEIWTTLCLQQCIAMSQKIFLSFLTSGSGWFLTCYVPGDVVWNCAECPAWDKPPTEESGCVDPASIGCWKIDIFFIKGPYATLCFKVCVHFNTIFWIFRHTSHQEMVALYIKFIL